MFKPGDIGFVIHHDHLISKIIAWFMKSKFSHSFLVIGKMGEMDLILETSDFEVIISPLEKYYKETCSVEIYSFDIAESQQKQVLDHALKTHGQIYGYLQLISFGIRRLLMRVGIRLRNFFRQGLVCCAVPLYGYTKVRGTPLTGIDPEAIDTEELYQIAKKGRLVWKL